MSDSHEPVPKKRRRMIGSMENDDDFGEDQVETPRASDNSRPRKDHEPQSPSFPTRRQAHHLHSTRLHLLSGNSSVSSSVPSLPHPSRSESRSSAAGSRTSSPTKRIAAMELNPDGLEVRTLSLSNKALPGPLADFLSELEDCSQTGAGILSLSRQDEIRKQAVTDRSFSTVRDYMYADTENRDALGETPCVSDVLSLLNEARECQDSMQSEAGWNTCVHFPLLFRAIYGQQRRRQLVGAMPCTTAKIISEYLPTASPSKMIDFAMYISPDDASPVPDPLACEAIQNLRRTLPCGVINHTDFLPLRNRPVVVGIETKKRGGRDQTEAELQIGTWHAAHWKMLARLVDDAGGDSGGLDKLPFLPAVLVCGHEWSFAATTREGRKTILWLERGFGSTTSPLGVYKAIWGLQRLARWAADVYWPWFRDSVLGTEVGALAPHVHDSGLQPPS